MAAGSMKEEWRKMSDNILHLTLEIITLLTGERCAVVKMASIEGLLQGLYPPLSGEQHPITAPPPACPAPEGNIQQKVLEVINQVMELLTGGERRSPSHGNCDVKNEIPEQCGILEDREDHSEAEMEDQPRGGSDKRTPPERRLHPPHHPGDSTQEHHPAGGSDKRTPPERRLHPPHHPGDSIHEGHPAGGSDERTPPERRLHPPHHPGDSIHEGHPAGGSDERTTPERRLHPPHHPGDSIHEGHPAGEFWERDPLERPPHLHYSKIFIQEEHEIPDHDQCGEGTGGNFTEQGTSISHHSNEELEMRVVVKEEEEEGLWTAGDLDHGPLSVGNAPEETLRSSPECNQDGDNLDVSSKEDPATPSFHPTFPITPSFYPALPTNLSFHPTFPITPSFYPALPSSGRSADPASQERSSEDRPPRGPRECPVCGKCFTSKTAYNNHRRVHSENRPYCCSVCSKRFKQKIHLVTHQEGHVRKQSLTCPMCGKHFENKVRFALHQRYHAGDAIHACPECGKEYPSKSKLNQHQKRHMTEKPFACTECDYRGWFRSDLVLHFRTHTGEKPFVCSECGKSFRGKFLLRRHQSKKH